MTRSVYLAQVNNTFGNQAFLPYSVGLLQAYAQTVPIIRDNYSFDGFIYLRENISDVVTRTKGLDVFGASCYIWNFNYSVALSKAIKEVNPNCLIVLGGPHVPTKSDGFFLKHPYIDILVHYEGELTFSEILTERLNLRPEYEKILGVSVNRNRETIKTSNRSRFPDLDELPSPYLTGVFDDLFTSELDLHASQETHRGCPYSCIFCISEDSVVDTDSGSKFVQNVKSGDKILGWNEDRSELVWNAVDGVICNGEREVLCIVAGVFRLEATEDHEVYTEKGWRELRNIKSGDRVLFGMWRINNRENREEVLLGFVSDEERQSYEESRGQREAEQDNEEEDSLWRGSSLYEYRGGEKGNWRYCKEATIESEESNEGSQSSEEAGKNKQFAELTQDFREDDKGESNEEFGFSGESCQCFGGSNRESQVEEEVAEESGDSAESVREKSYEIYEGAKPSVSICRRSQFLGGKEWESEESRFCSCRRGNQEGSIGSWDILAQRFEKCKERIRFLREGRVGSVYHLGERTSDECNGMQDSRVCWLTVESVEPSGVKKVYDVVNSFPSHNFFANGILVSNCDWGSSVFTKVRKFGDKRLEDELEWFSRKKIGLLYNCDANHGMFERDIELTKRMVELKKRTGYPKKFRAAYAKNSGERVYTINKLLAEEGMSKGATLSFQSMDEDVLTLIKRKNIGVEVYKDLMRKYRAENIPTYSEIIIGLPGESYNSLADGVDTLLNAGAHDSLQIYVCELLPNSEMSSPEFRSKYGIKSVVVPALFFHSTPSPDPYPEHYELVVETDTLSSDDWLKCQVFSWAVQCFHCLGMTQKLAVFVKHYLGISYRSFYEGLLRFGKGNSNTSLGKMIEEVESLFKGMLEGRGWGVIDERFGNIIWPPEEGGFLKLVFDFEFFWDSMMEFLTLNLGLEQPIADTLLRYQKLILPMVGRDVPCRSNLRFHHNIHEYLESCYCGNLVNLKYDCDAGFLYTFHQDKEFTTLEDFAKEVVWYGRKGGTPICKVERV